MKELTDIQTELKVPKNQYNSFGKYKYRSLEDITEAVRPHLKAHECTLTMNDDVIVLGNRFYIKATATITNRDGEQVSVSAYAREPETKKGMDDSQITGTASSYARKYACNGLFCIDDSKDADMDEMHNETKARAQKNKTASTSDSNASTVSNRNEHVDELTAEIKKYADEHNMTMREIAKDYSLNNKTATAERLKEVLADLKKGEQTSMEDEFAAIDEEVPF